MNLQQQTVSPGRNRSQRHGWNQIPAAHTMGGINDNRQMAELLDGGNSAYIKRIAGIIFKSPDTPLTEDNILIPLGHDIFGGHKPLLDGGA